MNCYQHLKQTKQKSRESVQTATGIDMDMQEEPATAESEVSNDGV